jgi:predicted NUDIX family NTP pyrophosphohydrolase
MAKVSAGLLMFRRGGDALEVLLVHPGGPYWMNKDVGAWSIPKGEVEPGEEPFAAAQREFEEEIGATARGEFFSLGEIRQASGKIVRAWAVEGDCDVSNMRSNTFSMIWPPKSGKPQSFPEIDRAEWFSLDAARNKIIKGQIPFLERLATDPLGD